MIILSAAKNYMALLIVLIFDLKNHMNSSGQDMNYTDPETGEKFLPHVVEPTFGLNRTVLVVLCDAYIEESERVVLKLNPKIAPYKAAVFPLLKNKPELVEKAREVYNELKNISMSRGTIGATSANAIFRKTRLARPIA